MNGNSGEKEVHVSCTCSTFQRCDTCDETKLIRLICHYYQPQESCSPSLFQGWNKVRDDFAQCSSMSARLIHKLTASTKRKITVLQRYYWSMPVLQLQTNKWKYIKLKIHLLESKSILDLWWRSPLDYLFLGLDLFLGLGKNRKWYVCLIHVIHLQNEAMHLWFIQTSMKSTPCATGCSTKPNTSLHM